MDMNIPPPSLKQAAIFQTAKHLYISRNIYDQAKAQSALTFNDWLELNCRIIRKDVETLGLQQSLKQCLIDILKPLGFEMYNLMFTFRTLKIEVNRPFEICLTISGSVDYEKTAERFVRDETNDLSSRFRLACFYCMNDYIVDLYQPEVFDDHSVLNNIESLKFLTTYWSHYAENKLGELETSLNSRLPLNEYGMKNTMKHSSSAVKFFWGNLTPQRRNKIMVPVMNYMFSETFMNQSLVVYFLRQIDESQFCHLYYDISYILNILMTGSFYHDYALRLVQNKWRHV